MNQQLYASLANAHAVLANIDELHRQIREQCSLMPEETEVVRQTMRLSALRYDKRRRLGFLFGAIGTLGMLLEMILLPSLVERPDEVVGIVVTLAVLCLPPLLVGGLLLNSFFREKREIVRSLAAAEQVRRHLDPVRQAEIAACKVRCGELARQANLVWRQKGGYLNFLPREYVSLPCVSLMLEKVRSGRVTTLRGALMAAAHLRHGTGDDCTVDVVGDVIFDSIWDSVF